MLFLARMRAQNLAWPLIFLHLFIVLRPVSSLWPIDDPFSLLDKGDSSNDNEDLNADIRRRERENSWTSLNQGILPQDCGRVFKLGEKSSGPINEFTGAHNTKPGYYPSYVELVIPQAENEAIRCGGTLISNRHILTSALCFGTSNSTRALVSTSIKQLSIEEAGKSQYWTVKICSADQLTADNWDESLDSVVVAKLNEPLELSKNVQPACLPTAPMPMTEQAYVVGMDVKVRNVFGATSNLQVVPARWAECYKNEKFEYRAESEWQRICATASYPTEYKGSLCGGDTGAPLLAFQSGRQTIFGTFMPNEAWCLTGFTYAASFADIYKKKDEIMKMIKMLQKST